jgi:Fe-S-cluster containining protein
VVTDDSALPAGPFSAWLRGIHAALAAEADSDVPCGTCTACCTSSQFVHIEPDEVDTLAHIPSEVLFPAPRLPAGHVLMGYDERGHCPMLVDGACSIYEHRPRTCRTYDCRIFPAAGVEADIEKPLIAAQARRWRFEHPTAEDRSDHDAVLAAAQQVDAAANATEHAVLAIRVAAPSRLRPAPRRA